MRNCLGVSRGIEVSSMKEWRAEMRLTMAERRVLIKSFAPRYRKKRKKVKGEVLTELL